MDIATLEAQEQRLVLSRFDESVVLAIGVTLVELGRARNHPILIDIRTPQWTLFRAVLPGANVLNDRWVRRKSNTVFLFGCSSLLMGTRNREKGETLARHGCDPSDFADNGGSFPLRVAGAGVLAAVTVSGLPQVDDHALVVEALEQVINSGAV
jgi:uncharacterized protein (UPF0303 family)